jgi:hypothetical protein
MNMFGVPKYTVNKAAPSQAGKATAPASCDVVPPSAAPRWRLRWPSHHAIALLAKAERWRALPARHRPWRQGAAGAGAAVIPWRSGGGVRAAAPVVEKGGERRRPHPPAVGKEVNPDGRAGLQSPPSP